VAGRGSSRLAHPARRTLRSERLRRAVFLDRDGTLIEAESYPSDPKRVVLLPRTAAALSDLRDAGFTLVVVTNQSGIARGLFSENEYHAVAKRLDDVLTEAGSPVDVTMYCPHHPDFGPACQCRKPATGMYRRAAAEFGLDLADSYYVGDRVRDVAPARELGGVGVLVRTGYGAKEEARIPAGTAVVDDLGGAAHLISNGERAGVEETLTPPEGSGRF
jgi:D-glycero-D-manno-heptose 1,7-bisphosphate phosphatase